MKNNGVETASLEIDEYETTDLPVRDLKDAGIPEDRELNPEEVAYYRGLIESVIFLAQEPISVATLARKCSLDRRNARALADATVDDYAERDGGVLLREISGGYQFVTSDRYSEKMRELYREQKKETLSRSALETLSIISYKQPITLPEIEEIRGVNSRAHITTLMTRRLIKSQGYRPVPGRPTLYVTSRKFLTHFSLNTLADLPALEEIKELPIDDLE